MSEIPFLYCIGQTVAKFLEKVCQSIDILLYSMGHTMKILGEGACKDFFIHSLCDCFRTCRSPGGKVFFVSFFFACMHSSKKSGHELVLYKNISEKFCQIP